MVRACQRREWKFACGGALRKELGREAEPGCALQSGPSHWKPTCREWENLVTACVPCNARKADHLLHEVRGKPMKLRSVPREPCIHEDPAYTVGVFSRVPEEWASYLPEAQTLAVEVA